MFVFLDIETTGFDGTKDQLLEIAAIKWDGEKECGRFDTLIALPQDFQIPPMISGLTGITNEMCEESGKNCDDAIAELQQFISADDTIVGHNISFDIGFLNHKGASLQNKGLDTFLISVLMFGKNETSHSLEMLAMKYGIVQENAHRAMSDVEANLQLYIMLQSMWHNNKNDDFQNFIQAKKDVLDFPESVFFLNPPKIDFIPRSVPQDIAFPDLSLQTGLFPLSDDWWNVSGQCVFLETQYSEGLLHDAIAKAQEHQKQLCIAYPLDETENTLEVFEQVKKLFPSLSSVFFGNPNHHIDEKKWKAFLSKSSFDRFETIVLMKILRAKQDGSEIFLRFMGDEWKPARMLFANEEFVPEPTEDIVFLPFSQVYHVPPHSKLIVLRGENIETMLEEKEKIKLFEKRLFEDLPSFSRTAFDNISQALRSVKGENKYSLPVYESEFKFLKTVTDGIAEIEKSLLQDDSWASVPWKHFFELKQSKEYIFCIEIFPDNALAFVLTPKLLQSSFDELTMCGDGIVIMGRAFPRNAQGTLQFTFQHGIACIDIPWQGKYAKVLSEGNDESIENALVAKNNVIVSVGSKKAADEIVDRFRNFCGENNVFIAAQKGGSIRKIRSQLSQSECFLAVGTPSFLDNIRVENTQNTIGYIPKLVFDPPNHPILKYRRDNMRNDFEDFVVPRAYARLHREMRRISSASQHIIADPKLHAAWAKWLAKSVEM